MNRILLMLLATCAIAMCQDKLASEKPASYTPSKEQHLELENQFLRAKLARADAFTADQHFQQEFAKLRQTCVDIVKENKWPDTVQCNLDTLDFAEQKPQEKPAEKPAPKKPTEKPAPKGD